MYPRPRLLLKVAAKPAPPSSNRQKTIPYPCGCEHSWSKSRRLWIKSRLFVDRVFTPRLPARIERQYSRDDASLCRRRETEPKMVRDRGFEPLTPSVSRKCSTPELTAQPSRKDSQNPCFSGSFANFARGKHDLFRRDWQVEKTANRKENWRYSSTWRLGLRSAICRKSSTAEPLVLAIRAATPVALDVSKINVDHRKKRASASIRSWRAFRGISTKSIALPTGKGQVTFAD